MGCDREGLRVPKAIEETKKDREGLGQGHGEGGNGKKNHLRKKKDTELLF